MVRAKRQNFKSNTISQLDLYLITLEYPDLWLKLSFKISSKVIDVAVAYPGLSWGIPFFAKRKSKGS